MGDTEDTGEKPDPTLVSNCGMPDLTAVRARFRPVKTGDIIGGNYRIEDLLGEGGMGSVLLATQMSVQRKVAVKTLHGDMLSEDRHVKRFYREATSASQLSHPNIVRVFDFGIDTDLAVPYIVMEYLEGRTLKDLVDEAGPRPEAEAIVLTGQIARALVAAHAQDVVHRDLKPENVIVRELEDGERLVKVLDFGLAKALTTEAGAMSLSASGVLTGTPTYMSPEQIQGDEIDLRCDLYSLGCILHFILTGNPPYLGKESLTVLMKHVNEPTPPLPDTLSNGQPPSAGLRALYESLMAKSAKDRPASSQEAYRELKGLLEVSWESVEVKGIGSPSKRASVPDLVTSTGAIPAPASSNVSRRVWLGVAAVVLVAGAITGIVAVSGGGDTVPKTAPTVTPEQSDPKTADARQATVTASAAPDANRPSADTTQPRRPPTQASGTDSAVVPKDATPAPSKPALHKVKLVTTPAGATVMHGEKALGETPLQVTVAKGVTATYTLKLKGYAPTPVVVKDTETQVEVTLRKPTRKKTRKRVRRRKKAPAGTKKKAVKQKPRKVKWW